MITGTVGKLRRRRGSAERIGIDWRVLAEVAEWIREAQDRRGYEPHPSLSEQVGGEAAAHRIAYPELEIGMAMDGVQEARQHYWRGRDKAAQQHSDRATLCCPDQLLNAELVAAPLEIEGSTVADQEWRASALLDGRQGRARPEYLTRGAIHRRSVPALRGR